MPLVNTGDLLKSALAGKFAVGGFEPYTIDQIQAIIEVAEEEQTPVILQFWSEVIETWGFPTLTCVVRELAGRASVPIALHLDHSLTEELAYQALDAGFTSVTLGSLIFRGKSRIGWLASHRDQQNIPTTPESSAVAQLRRSNSECSVRFAEGATR